MTGTECCACKRDEHENPYNCDFDSNGNCNDKDDNDNSTDIKYYSFVIINTNIIISINCVVFCADASVPSDRALPSLYRQEVSQD